MKITIDLTAPQYDALVRVINTEIDFPGDKRMTRSLEVAITKIVHAWHEQCVRASRRKK